MIKIIHVSALIKLVVDCMFCKDNLENGKRILNFLKENGADHHQAREAAYLYHWLVSAHPDNEGRNENTPHVSDVYGIAAEIYGKKEGDL